MPFNRVAFTRISHVCFSVRDLMTSVGWYRSVLGLSELDYAEGEGWRAVLMIHEPSSTVIELRHHDAGPGDAVDPSRAGLDHVGFEVASRAALEDWQEHFIRLSVDHTPVADRGDGAVLAFRDPDGTQHEMLYRENHR